MIDTIRLRIPIYNIQDYYDVPTRNMTVHELVRTRAKEPIVQIVTPRNFMDGGGYFARLSIGRNPSKGDYSYCLYAEFSAPILIFGENCNELVDDDLLFMAIMLRDRIFMTCDVVVPLRHIILAPVSRVDFSKNIVFNSPRPVLNALDLLAKTEVTKHKELTRGDYSQGGGAVRVSTKHTVAKFYDKNAQLLNEGDTFSAKGLRRLGHYILRYEVTIGTAGEIRRILHWPKQARSPTLKDVFKRDISRKVLLKYWGEFTRGMDILSLNVPNPKAEAIDLLDNECMNTVKEVATYFGMRMLTNQIGHRGVRGLVDAYETPRAWQKYKRYLNSINIAPTRYECIKAIDQQLANFTPLRIHL